MVFFLLILISGVSFIPFNGLPFVAFERGILGDLSISSMFLMGLHSLQKAVGKQFFDSKGFYVAMVCFSLGALFLYPCSLGLTYFDPYVLGYQSRVFVVALFATALLALYFNQYLLLSCISLSVFSFLFKILPSMNLWDYLIDPILGFFALGFCLKKLFRKLILRSREKKSETLGA